LRTKRNRAKKESKQRNKKARRVVATPATSSLEPRPARGGGAPRDVLEVSRTSDEERVLNRHVVPALAIACQPHMSILRVLCGSFDIHPLACGIVKAAHIHVLVNPNGTAKKKNEKLPLKTMRSFGNLHCVFQSLRNKCSLQGV
jgi:hypothetical protein